ncbi:11178_t:CDS:2, partial [Rhizophagus irregularis]
DNSDAETFTDKFFNNILEDSDEEECSIKTIDNSSDDLTLEVGRCIKVENERRKQTIAFIKPMLDDIEWMCIHGHLKLLSIK